MISEAVHSGEKKRMCAIKVSILRDVAGAVLYSRAGQLETLAQIIECCDRVSFAKAVQSELKRFDTRIWSLFLGPSVLFGQIIVRHGTRL